MPTLPDLRSNFFELNKEMRYFPTSVQTELENVRSSRDRSINDGYDVMFTGLQCRTV